MQTAHSAMVVVRTGTATVVTGTATVVTGTATVVTDMTQLGTAVHVGIGHGATKQLITGQVLHGPQLSMLQAACGVWVTAAVLLAGTVVTACVEGAGQMPQVPLMGTLRYSVFELVLPVVLQ
jgi:hypothetical protein